MKREDARQGTFWRSGWGIALCALLAFAALVFIVEHRLHALQWLPLALLLACPLMHLFMHRGGHGHHDSRGRDDKET